MAEVGNQNTNQTTITIPGDKGLFGNDKKSRIYTVTDTDTGEITVYDDDKWIMGAGWGDTKIGSYNPETQQWTFNKDANDAERKYFTSNTGRKIVTNNSQQTLFKSKYDAEIAAGTDPEEARKIANGYSGSVTKEEKAPQVAFALTGIPKQETQRDEMAGKPGQTLIYPQDHAQGDFDFIKIVPIEYIPMLQAGQTFDEARRSLSVKERYLRRERVVGSTMFLPMVPGISESNATDWAGNTLNPLQMAAGQIAANSISNFDVTQLADAFIDASILDGGTLSFTFKNPEILINQLQQTSKQFKNSQRDALAQITSIEEELINRYLPGGTITSPRSAMEPLSEFRERLDPFLGRSGSESVLPVFRGDDGIIRFKTD